MSLEVQTILKATFQNVILLNLTILKERWMKEIYLKLLHILISALTLK